MKRHKKISTMPGVWGLLFGLIVISFFLGDVYYDVVQTPERAIAQCGKGKVKAVVTTGFYKREVTCFLR